MSVASLYQSFRINTIIVLPVGRRRGGLRPQFPLGCYFCSFNAEIFWGLCVGSASIAVNFVVFFFPGGLIPSSRLILCEYLDFYDPSPRTTFDVESEVNSQRSTFRKGGQRFVAVPTATNCLGSENALETRVLRGALFLFMSAPSKEEPQLRGELSSMSKWSNLQCDACTTQYEETWWIERLCCPPLICLSLATIPIRWDSLAFLRRTCLSTGIHFPRFPAASFRSFTARRLSCPSSASLYRLRQ